MTVSTLRGEGASVSVEAWHAGMTVKNVQNR